jgi:hypothetical protein
MTALLLGMQIGSAKDAYDNADAEVKEMAGKVIYLDRLLANYGPESAKAREIFRVSVSRGVDQVWPPRGGAASFPSPIEVGGEALYHEPQALSPEGPAKAALKAEAIALALDIGRLRWLVFAQAKSTGSVVFLVLVVVWLTLVFASFGLLGTYNALVVVTLIVCALSVSTAIGLIMELNRPFGGLIQISSEPMRNAIGLMGT